MATPELPPANPNVILLTDLDSDIDDVSDVVYAMHEHKQGRINLLGIITDSSGDRSADCAYALAKYMDPSITPSFIGAYQGANGSNTSVYTDEVSAEFGLNVGRSSYTDGVQKLRALVAASGGDVMIVAVGLFTVTQGFMNSEANAGGDGLPSGMDLITSKVHTLVPVAGTFPESESPEFNINFGPRAASIDVVDNWPGQIVFVGIEVGQSIEVGMASPPREGIRNPIEYAWELHDASGPDAGYLRPGWGLMGIHYASRGVTSGLEPSELGTVTIDPDTGNNAWSSAPGNAAYCTKVGSDTTYEAEFAAMYALYAPSTRVVRMGWA